MAKANEKKESKAAIFKRLATSRVNKAVAAIDSIGKLANPASYDYTKSQVKLISDAITKAQANLALRFENPGASVNGGFKL